MNNSSAQTIRIATRASPLALYQANHTAELLRDAMPDFQIEVVNVSTAGDQAKNEPLQQLGGVGVFTREIQKAVLDGRADIAVHSLKDLPTEPTNGLTLAAVPEREWPYDVLVLSATIERKRQRESDSQVEADDPFANLVPNARVGTGSLRRRAQLLHHLSNLKFFDVRGNVETRLRKLDADEYDALILAEAGLRRLGLNDRIHVALKPPILYPAVGQGALGIECRVDDSQLCEFQKLSDPATFDAVTAERSLLSDLRAGCHAAVGVTTRQSKDDLTLDAVVLSSDGRQRLTASATLSANQAESLGKLVAEELRRQGADSLINTAHDSG